MEGIKLNDIELESSIIAVGDFIVTANSLWLLDLGAIPASIVQVNFNGQIENQYTLPSGLQIGDGLSGISQDAQGILIEKGGGYIYTRYLNWDGELINLQLSGLQSNSSYYSAHPADMKSDTRNHGYIELGSNKINVTVENDLAGLRILYIEPNGGFYARIDEVGVNNGIIVDSKIYKYDAIGNFIGMARVPLDEQYIYVPNAITANAEGIYYLVTKADHIEIQKLEFTNSLEPIIIKPENPNPLFIDIPLTPNECRSSIDMITVASKYVENKVYLDAYHIENNASCSSRTKPRYLTSPKTYESVPYAWNMWDTVDGFNSFMQGGYNQYFAGDIDDPNSGCGRGVDCSGLVSRAWGLNSHYGTCSLNNISNSLPGISYLRQGDILNKCSSHTILFDEFYGNGMKVYEANAGTDLQVNYDRVVHVYRDLSSVNTYTPLRYQNKCSTGSIRFAFIPFVRKPDSSFDVLPDPYPMTSSAEFTQPYP